MKSKKFLSISMLTKISILSALAFVVMSFEFPLPIAPPFYKLDFSEVIVLIGGFALGPLAAILIESLKILLNILFTGTQTNFVGEIANLVIGLSFVLPAVWIYQRHKTFKTAIIGMVVGTITLTVIGSAMNYFILLPAYSFFYKLPLDVIVSMGAAINPTINSTLTFVILATAPFNLIKGILSSVIVTLVYKRVSPILKEKTGSE